MLQALAVTCGAGVKAYGLVEEAVRKGDFLEDSERKPGDNGLFGSI